MRLYCKYKFNKTIVTNNNGNPPLEINGASKAW